MYSIGEFSKLIKVSAQTLRNWDNSGKLKPIVLASGHRRYTDEHLGIIVGIEQTKKITLIYCRESTKAQSASLDSQVERCKKFCEAAGIAVDRVISEFGSGMNFKRKGFLELISLLLADTVATLVVHHKDRLVRFGFPLIEHICHEMNVKLVVIDGTEEHKSKSEEFAEDLIAIIHHFSMRLYGSRSYAKELNHENL